MTGTADRNDYAAVIRRLEERIRVLETSTPAARTSITRGQTTAGAAFIRAAGGGQSGAGTGYFRSDGALTDSSGTLNFAVNVKGVASGTFDGYVRGGLGVEAPLENGGPLVSLGPAVKEAERVGQSGYDNAIVARNAAATAQSGVNGLASRMSAVEGDVSTLQSQFVTLKNVLNSSIDGVNELIKRMADVDGKSQPPVSRAS